MLLLGNRRSCFCPLEQHGGTSAGNDVENSSKNKQLYAHENPAYETDTFQRNLYLKDPRLQDNKALHLYSFI
jgi:hypothetical protein